jgi:enoyl-CoA hydratase/carnithine racemase
MLGKVLLASAPLPLHVGLGLFPQAIGLLFLVHLRGHHHAVGYALEACVSVADVLDVGHVVTDGVVDTFSVTIAVEEVFPDGIE